MSVRLESLRSAFVRFPSISFPLVRLTPLRSALTKLGSTKFALGLRTGPSYFNTLPEVSKTGSTTVPSVFTYDPCESATVIASPAPSALLACTVTAYEAGLAFLAKVWLVCVDGTTVVGF